MANSINVIQNKWSCITQLKGTSGCLCRSCCYCSLCCACSPLSLVRGPSNWQIPGWLPLHQTLVWAAAVQSCCFKGRWGKQRALCGVGSEPCFVSCVPLTLYASSSVTGPYCHAKDSLVALLPGEFSKRVLPLSMGFLSTQSSWERMAGSCSWQPLPEYSRLHVLREGRFWV